VFFLGELLIEKKEKGYCLLLKEIYAFDVILLFWLFGNNYLAKK
jgi:hypothetical protein